MKAILILDKMPENCMECPLRFKDGDTDDWFRFRCHMSTDQIPKEGRLNNCELKPLPEEKHRDTRFNDIAGAIDYGWNSCLDALEGKDMVDKLIEHADKILEEGVLEE